MIKKILFPNDDISHFIQFGGGKGAGLKRLVDAKVEVPPFIVLTNEFFYQAFFKGFLNQKSIRSGTNFNDRITGFHF
jgi:phosphoenolpyruvate synthase/pyruvate phosphate dikinase